MKIIHTSLSEKNPKVQLGPYEIESLIAEEEEAAATAYRIRIEPNQKTSTSYHRIAEEIYYILEGRGIALLDGIQHILAPGDFLRLPPGTQHSFITEDQPLVMLDIHCPGSRPNRDVYFVDSTPDGFSDGSQTV